MSDIENTEVKEMATETDNDVTVSTDEARVAYAKQEVPTNIWLQFDTISIGTPGSEIVTYDLRTIFAGLARLGMLQLVPVENSEEKKD